jgi:hypothetical protein
MRWRSDTGPADIQSHNSRRVRLCDKERPAPLTALFSMGDKRSGTELINQTRADMRERFRPGHLRRRTGDMAQHALVGFLTAKLVTHYAYVCHVYVYHAYVCDVYACYFYLFVYVS